MIRIQGLHKFFNKGRQNEIHVINDVSLELPEKGMVAIFGKSGCGKTTLLNVIGGLDRFAEGSLTIENQSIRENTDVIRNRYIGYIFQNYNLNKAESCFENVADALRLCGMTDEDEIEARVTAALTNVGMEKYAKRPPDTLSGGQQQRIAIARAIVKNPRIILADEPTGNLDEANTVMIMDLLKAIAKEHLVLLVTHEANLVDYYCDTVIELQDGRIIDIKENRNANGFAARDKNAVYLGELTQRELKNGDAEIEYYGEKPEAPIRLKIVNNGGKIYLQVATGGVQVLDEFSEVRLCEGVYGEKKKQNDVSRDIDMSKLPPIEGHNFGRLFSFRSSLKSGYVSNFQKRKKGKKVLRRCMSLFAAVVVFMSAIFGSVIGDLIEARRSYNHNVFYLYTPDGTVSKTLNEAVGQEETGVDFIRLINSYPIGDERIYFRTATFETFAQSDYSTHLNTTATFLDASLIGELRTVVGKREALTNEEMVITTRVADALLEKSTLGYIDEYRDLLGLACTRLLDGAGYPRIVGVVESDEPAVYMTGLALAKLNVNNSSVVLASDRGVQVAEGEAILLVYRRYQDLKLPEVGETVKVHGKDITIVGVKENCTDYQSWLRNNGIVKKEPQSYFSELIAREQPELSKDSEAFKNAVEAAMTERLYEYYDYQYAEIDGFLKNWYFFDASMIELWLYLEKGIEVAKYQWMPEDYYQAKMYKERYGKYPTQEQLWEHSTTLPNCYEVLKNYVMQYEEEFYKNGYYSHGRNAYLVSDADFVAFSKQRGETQALEAVGQGDIYYEYEKTASVDAVGTYEIAEDVYVDDFVYSGNQCFTVIHSNDPKKTDAWLRAEFGELTMPYSYETALITPNTIFRVYLYSELEGIVASLLAMVVILVLMSICMYFIMRSSLMNRIKEVGIYRAIGVSRKNLIFKFFVEAIVLTALTVLVGYVLSSAFIYVCFGMSSLVESIFYYPLWMACADLCILCALSLFFGTLPIMGLLRKTPSEILAKYDI